VARSSILAPHRLIIAGVVVVLFAVTFLFLRGPAPFQRLYYPLPDEYVPYIAASAARHDVNPYLVAAVINAESDWREDVVSEAGAVGLMQVLPSTAREMQSHGRADPTLAEEPLSDPSANIEHGTAYLRFLVERYHEIEPALAAYNAGLANVDAWVQEGEDIRETIEFPETRHYVLRVMRARDRYAELYPGVFDGGGE